SRFEGEEELAFRHALLREGAYATLTSDDRTLGHRLAGQWLEGRGEQDARALAEHFEKGGDWTRAGRHYVHAARQATWGGDGAGSAALARRGLALPIEGELRVRLLGALCETAVWRPETAVSMQREAEELVQVAARGSAPWAQGMMARFTGATVGGRIEEVLAVVVELQQAEVAPDAVESMALALGAAIFALDMMGHTRQADPLLAKFEGLMQASADSSPIAMSLLYGCRVMRADGNFFGNMKDAGKARELSREAGSRIQENCAAVFKAIHAWCLGAVEEAERTLRAVSIADAELGSLSSYRPFVLAWLLADRGALREAEAFAAEVMALARGRALPADEGRGHWILAEVRRRAGDLDGADDEVEAAVATLRAYCPRDLTGPLATKAALRLAQGRPEDALAAAEEGMALYGATGMCSHFFRGAFLRLVHVESLEAAGRSDDARAALAEARARIFAVAGRIDDPGYRTSFLESVPENRRTLALAREWLGEGG
ncbi:MAG TPA: serine/threonine-protein kinase PknK, partial [Polyangiaceae bacterium]|nr:serine/threonine-protein kinase PknK [Polyangiaceae bacterium]